MKGNIGLKGEVGIGEKGMKGEVGIKGLQGEKGNIGERGLKGNLGAPFQIIFQGNLTHELMTNVQNNKYPYYDNDTIKYKDLSGNEPFNPNNQNRWNGHFIYTQIVDVDELSNTETK